MSHVHHSMGLFGTLLLLAGGLVCHSPLLATEPELNVPPEGYRAIFNGQDISGWRGMGT